MTHALLLLCRQLGLLVNEAKSELIPSQSIVFLGEQLDLVTGTAFPAEDRENAIRTTISRILQEGEVSFVEAESLLGYVVSVVPTVLFKSSPSATARDAVYAEGSSARSVVPHDGPISGHAQMMDIVSSTADRIPFPTPDLGANCLHRRIAREMGSGISGPFVAREVATHEAPHTLTRTQGSPYSHSTSAASAPSDEHVISHRQCDSGFLSQDAGMYQVESVTETNQESVFAGGQSSDYSDSAAYNGLAQRPSRSGVDDRAGITIRIGPELRGPSLAESSVLVGSSGSGRVCQL